MAGVEGCPAAECGGAPVFLEVAGFRFDGANLLEMLGEALVIWESSGGQILFANEAARALYGYGCGEIDGLSMDEIFPGWEEVFNEGAFSLLTAAHRNKNGIFFPVHVTCRHLDKESGDIMMMTASAVSPENMARDSVALASSIQRGFLPPDLDGDGRSDLLLTSAPRAGEIGPAVFIGRGSHGLRQHVEGSAIKRRFCLRRLSRCCFRRGDGFRFLLFPGCVEHVEINELVASRNERAGRLTFPEAIDGDALFPDASSKACKIAIA